MGDVIITRTNGGLGRTLGNLDHVSALLMWNDNKPTSFGTNKTKVYKSILEAEADGIVENSLNYKFEWYHINEYFRIQPDGKLYLHISPASGAVPHTYNEILDVQVFANGEIRQMGIVATDAAFTTAEIDKIQAHCETLELAKTPVQVVVSFDYDAITTIDNLPDLSLLSTPARNVTVVISQDGSNKGYALSATNNAAVGATLGAISLAKVYESIGWTGKFNIASSELNDPILAFGGIKYSAISATDKGKLEDRRYLYIKKYSNQTGSYFNDNKTSDSAISDYNEINLNRTYHKAFRLLYDALFPLINSPVKVVTGGLLTAFEVSKFKNAASNGIASMLSNGEISNYDINVLNEVNIFQDPTIYIQVRILPIGTAKEINVTLGYSVNI